MSEGRSSAGQVFFILACARSGSTSLARILDEATNAHCAVEPAPNLNWETREMMEGRLADPRALIEKVVAPRVTEAIKEWPIYGEKNLTYGPFIPYLYERFDCRFVLLVREGAEVVRSLMDWHNRMFGSVYRECRDPGDLAPRAMAAAGNLPLHLDTSDYSRPRPLPGMRYYEEWEGFSREEMCAYYWSTIYDLYLDQLARVPDSCWIRLDYTKPSATDVLRVAAFLGLRGLDEERVQKQLDSRINSLKDRADEPSRYPHWTGWPPELKDRFRRIAGDTSWRLNFS